MITFAEASRLLRYDPETGIIIRMVRTSSYAKMDEPAGCVGKNGHHLAWLLMTGEWPAHEIDHRNGDRSNNKWRNLRAATSSQNKQNRRLTPSNKSGVKGVCWARREGRWRASINVPKQKQIHLGYFICPALASCSYSIAASTHFGEFARAA